MRVCVYHKALYINPLEGFDGKLHKDLFKIQTLLSVAGNISLRFSGNSEANDSELLENREEFFLRYFMKNNTFTIFKSSTTR